MRSSRLIEPLSVTDAIILAVVVAAMAYVFDPVLWITGGIAGLLAILLGAGRSFVMARHDDGHG